MPRRRRRAPRAGSPAATPAPPHPRSGATGANDPATPRHAAPGDAGAPAAGVQLQPGRAAAIRSSACCGAARASTVEHQRAAARGAEGARRRRGDAAGHDGEPGRLRRHPAGCRYPDLHRAPGRAALATARFGRSPRTRWSSSSRSTIRSRTETQREVRKVLRQTEEAR